MGRIPSRWVKRKGFGIGGHKHLQKSYMTKHITARLAWHDDGWNGRVCTKPKENTYCVGQHSYPGDMIAERRDLSWESHQDVAGKSCSSLDKIPPCIYSVNAFGKDSAKAFSDPPPWFNDKSQTKFWNLPPATICVWPYEEMYDDEVKNPEGKGQEYNYDLRLERAKAYFGNLTPDKSLIIYYVNYSNPFSEDDSKKYVVVGISRIKSLTDFMFYEGTSEENRRKYAGGFVWQMPITSHYPDQGFRLPYHVYRNNNELLSKILVVPENNRNFKYATRVISDDDSLELIEQLLQAVNHLIQQGDKTENWLVRRDWLISLIAELWDNRGPFPGLPKILGYLGFMPAIQFIKDAAIKNQEMSAYRSIFEFLNGKIDSLPGLVLDGKVKKQIIRQWKLKTTEERNLLTDIFPRFDLTVDQIKKITSLGRSTYGISVSLAELYENPYLIIELFVGDDPDDRIGLNKIDNGMFPSPELGLDNLAQSDDWRRFRALCVDILKKESKHTFIASDKVISDINRRLESFPRWKTHQFHEGYFDIDTEELSAALVIRENLGRKYIYLKTVYEAERTIEKGLRALANLPDIIFKKPVTEKHWHEFLYDGNSEIAKSNPKEYEEVLKGQAEVCQRIFVKPICVLSGAAGTGKTTIIRSIINAIEKAHSASASFQILSPTGKAADRIRVVTKKPASTIHAFLAQRGWLNDNLTFRLAGGRLENDISTYIIDESSMLDLRLTATLFQSINWSTVQRLIFVGDPNQLPPIGTGRVFADVIRWLKEAHSDSVGVLKMNIRQMENRLKNRGTGILDLAALYLSEELTCEAKWSNKNHAEQFFHKIQEADNGEIDKDLKILYWSDPLSLEKLLIKTIISDLEQDVGGKFDSNKPYELWSKAFTEQDGRQGASYQQVISPYRGELFGTENLNYFLQKALNGRNIEIHGTIGDVTYFDKVIQYVNRPKSNPYWAYNVSTKKREKIEVYNGEIGFVKPHAFDKNWKWPKFRLRQFQVYFSNKKDHWIEFSSANQVEQNLELAYVISVHKAQGSEFQRIYYVLPKNKKTLLSRELLYTGVTRAQRHLTLLVEEDIQPLLSLRRIERSHLLGINSSLFDFIPVPDEILNMREWYQEGKIHSTLSEYMVRSKSEVIIANLLFERNISFEYEMSLFASDGTFFLPDFTLSIRGEKWYWEHLGMMDNERYKRHWEYKKKWYEKFFPERLLTSKESSHLTKDAELLINRLL